MARKLTQEEYKDKIGIYGIVNVEPYINARTRINHICPVCKQIWNELPHNIISCGKRKCNKCSGYNVRLSQEEYEERLSKIGIKVVDKYINCTTKIKHICPICNEIWESKPDDILYNGHRSCKKCALKLKESSMANILKDVCLHEDTTTIVEYDAGFRGENGGISTYDIYIQSRNLLVECQSKYHDTKIEFDQMKKDFALNNGYKYIAIDNRNISDLEAIQIIFPYIEEIPQYISREYIGYGKKYNYADIQKLIDKGYTYKEIAKKLNITYAIVANSITSGKVKGKRK